MANPSSLSPCSMHMHGVSKAQPLPSTRCYTPSLLHQSGIKLASSPENTSLLSVTIEERKQFNMLEGLRTLVQTEKFKVFLLDQFGVLHDGRNPYPGAIETLQKLASTGRKLVILSNSSKRSSSTIERMAKLGFEPSMFCGAITSGELTHRNLLRREKPWFASLGRRCIHMTWSERGSISLEGLGLEIVEQPDSADFVLAHGTEALGKLDGTVQSASLDKLTTVLEKTVKKGLPLIVANPDLVTVEERALRIMPGTLGTKYEQLGGTVQYMGKPDPVIYEAAEELTGEKPEQMIAVGDSLLHDIQGAATRRIESVFVAGGIHANELRIDEIGDRPTPESLERLFQSYNIYPTYVLPSFRW